MFIDWYKKWYPGTAVEFLELRPFEVVDVVDELPQHESKVYPTRGVGNIDTIFIHHTVTPNDYPTEKIAAYHISENNWPGISYHYVISWDGFIEQVNYDSTISNHTYGENGHSIGIALKGDFTYHKPPDAQVEAAQWLANQLRQKYPTIHTVAGHKEAEQVSTACPGATWGNEWQIV